MNKPSSVIVWKSIHEIAQKTSKYFDLSYGRIIPETRKLARHYGECTPCDKCYHAEHIDETHCNEKVLFIRVHQLNRPRVALATSTIFRTLAHELAHLRVWGHGQAHREFEKEIVAYVKELGYRI